MNLKGIVFGAAAAVMVTAPFAATAAVVNAVDDGDVAIAPGDFVIGSALVTPTDLMGSFTLSADASPLRLSFVAANLQPRTFTTTDFVEIFVDGALQATINGMDALGNNRVFELGDWSLGLGQELTVAYTATGVIQGQAAVFDFSADVSQIPLPAAGWMFMAALGGLGVLARKRTAA